MDAAKDFSVLKGWITNFKTQQGRDPFFEDFPAEIGISPCHRTILSSIEIPVCCTTFVSHDSNCSQAWNGSFGKLTSKSLQQVSISSASLYHAVTCIKGSPV
jgi:hypothetical protein